MSTILLLMAMWFVLDVLITIWMIGKTWKITRRMAVVMVIVYGFFAVILVLAAVQGVTPAAQS